AAQQLRPRGRLRHRVELGLASVSSSTGAVAQSPIGYSACGISVIPTHPGVKVPGELPLITWARG
ncbi:MAG: hypothetical protein ACLP1X_21195, partial [Polyangiaceae bacterium]